jgi:hypothetical protein
MSTFARRISICVILTLYTTAGICATFDERLWEKYAEIVTPSQDIKGSLAGVYLVPKRLGNVASRTPFADLRVVTDRKEEVPWQIVPRRPQRRQVEIPHMLLNLSRTGNGDTWLELRVEKQDRSVNAVEIITPDSDFTRQVEVLGSPDGKEWNTLRRDGVIFDIPRDEKLRRTRITFPQTAFRHLAIRIIDGGAQPLTIRDVKVLQESDTQGQTYKLSGTTGKPRVDSSRQETSIVVRMDTVFPIDRLVIATPDRNFQRLVEVQVKGDTGEWEPWTRGSLFSFDTPTVHESHLVIETPEIAAREFRLVFRNLDSPPLSISGVSGEGYRRLLVFKQQGAQKLYLFWGNPRAEVPRYDLAGIISKQRLHEIPVGTLGEVRANPQFAGNDARLPLTERYRYLLYGVMVVAIVGLIFLQYRVFRRV